MRAQLNFDLAGRANLGAGMPPHRVYVIDDHCEVRQSLVMLLSTFGMEACSFSSAFEFLAKLPTLPPAPLLLDITMSGMNGIELLERLGELGTKWPVLIMTGLSDVPVVFRALALGAMAVLQKPFSAEDLESSVNSALASMSESDVALSKAISHASR